MKRNSRTDLLEKLGPATSGARDELLTRRSAPADIDTDEAEEAETDEERTGPAEPELNEIAAEELEPGHGPDDALGLYLRQMGAIPLLNRVNEIEVATRLERARNRFRISSLRCCFILHKTITMFEKINAGQTPLDPNVDIISTANLK